MIQEFLTIDEAAEKLKDRGYTPKKVLALVTAKQVPHHVRGGKIHIPFPEADPHFPPILPDPPADEGEEEKTPKGPGKGK